MERMCKDCAKKITIALGIPGRSLESWFSLTNVLVSKGWDLGLRENIVRKKKAKTQVDLSTEEVA